MNSKRNAFVVKEGKNAIILITILQKMQKERTKIILRYPTFVNKFRIQINIYRINNTNNNDNYKLRNVKSFFSVCRLKRPILGRINSIIVLIILTVTIWIGAVITMKVTMMAGVGWVQWVHHWRWRGLWEVL